jgi:hypothetical protein
MTAAERREQARDRITISLRVHRHRRSVDRANSRNTRSYRGFMESKMSEDVAYVALIAAMIWFSWSSFGCATDISRRLHTIHPSPAQHPHYARRDPIDDDLKVLERIYDRFNARVDGVLTVRFKKKPRTVDARASSLFKRRDGDGRGPSPVPNYHLRQINQPDVAGIKKPRAGRPGLFLLIFGQAAWGWGGESLSTWPFNFWRRESFPRAEPPSDLLSLLGRD